MNVFVFTQRLESLNKYNALKESESEILGPKTISVIGRYDRRSKYNQKNIIKYLNEKKDLYFIPFNLLYFEAAEEAGVADLFLKLDRKNMKEDRLDDDYVFREAVTELVDKIIKRLQELQKRLRWKNVNN